MQQPTLNKAFWKWFGNSVVRNEDGSPKVVYHGTGEKFFRFNTPAFFSERIDYAKEFTFEHDDQGRIEAKKNALVVSAYLSVQNPLDLTGLGLKKLYANDFLDELMERGVEAHSKELRGGVWSEHKLWWWVKIICTYFGNNYPILDQIKAAGYDGIVMYENLSVKETGHMRAKSWVAFSPSQIKSVDNDGTWDADDPNIRSNPEMLKPKLDELNRLAQTLSYYHWLHEHGLSWSEIVGIKREPRGSINFKLKDGRTAKFDHIPFSDEVIFNRPIYTPAENPDSLDRFRISRDKGKTWERIAADMGFYTPDRQDRETLRQGGVIESEEGWLIKLAGPEPEPSSNPPATPIILSRDYYHATPDGMAGKSILKDGLIIPRPGKAGKAYQSPRKDFVYMSPQLYYAAIYALGGVFMGEDYSRRDWRDPSRYGYIFMVHKGDLMDVEPDEDEVGEMATADRHKRGPDWLKSMAEWDARDSYSKKDKLRRAKDGECAYQSLIGKQLLKRLFRDQKEFLINMTGVNIANRGPVGFGAVWRLDKLRAPEIAKDGSNVLEIAERIK